MEKKLLELLRKKVVSNKTRHVKAEKQLNDPAEKVKLVSTKGLTKDLINNFSILNGGKYFGEDGPKII